MIAFGVCCNFMTNCTLRRMDLRPTAISGTPTNMSNRSRFRHRRQAPASLGLWLIGSLPHDEGTARMLLEEQVDFDQANVRPVRL